MKKPLTTTPGRTTPFQQIQKKYGLKKPRQIKAKIIWFHLQQLIRLHYTNPDTPKILDRYDRDWKLCEKEEQKKI